MIKRILLITFFLTCFILECNLSFSQDKMDAMKLIAKSNKTIYKLGEPINIILSLKNVSKKQVSLFHPSIFGAPQFPTEWALDCFITKPDGKEVKLERHINLSTYWPISKKDFKVLRRDETFDIPIKFRPLNTIYSMNVSEEFEADNSFVAIIVVPREWVNESEEQLRTRFNIKGAFYGIRAGKHGEFLELALQDIIKDVFNIEGEYKLKFEYKNYTNYYDPDKDEYEKNPLLKTRTIPNAWTGGLSDSLLIKIVK
ncbi:MAG: hypothetical protein AB1629_04360 [Candidatus Omnitrophota bacterium]